MNVIADVADSLVLLCCGRGVGETDTHTLAEMHPARGKRFSHLVIGSLSIPELIVYELLCLDLVITHSMQEMAMMGRSPTPGGRRWQ